MLSSTVKLVELMILASAEILLPDSSTIISPGTTLDESISNVLLSLITFTFTLINFFNASVSFFALYSWIVDTIASINIITAIAIPSIVSLPINERTDATIKT